jgi:hypothetical protein
MGKLAASMDGGVMNHQHHNQPRGLGSQVKRRRALAAVAAGLAVTAGLSGCSMLPGQTGAAPHPTLENGAATTAAVDSRVREFTSSIDSALDQVDRERLKAAAEKRAAMAAADRASADRMPVAVAPLTTGKTPPASEDQSPPSALQNSSGPQVILATSAGAAVTPIAASATPTAAPTAAPAPTIVAAAPAAAPALSPSAGSAKVAVTPDITLAAPTQLAAGPAASPAALALKAAPSIKPATSTAGKAIPVGTQAPSDTVITPIGAPQSSTPSAMGSMTAMVNPSEPAAGASASAAQVSSQAAVTAVPTIAAEPTLEEALAVLRKRVAEHPSLSTALALSLLDPDGKEAEIAKDLPEIDQKVYGDLLGALQGMNGATSTGTPTLADRTAPLLDVARKWQADADLQLPRLVLATRVDSFGVYNAIDSKFQQGRKHTVIIYCEVANFTSKKGDDNWYITKLSQQETLITEDGLLVWRPNAEEVEDRSMNQRHDFYLVKKLTIPENLAAGKYTLRMSVTDRNSGKISMVSLPIEIVTN